MSTGYRALAPVSQGGVNGYRKGQATQNEFAEIKAKIKALLKLT